MKLRRQLILVSLLTLSLPWAGCQYIQEMDTALRQGQTIALAASAQAVADRLAIDAKMINVLQQPAFSHGQYLQGRSQIYLHQLPTSMMLDGYDDDWRHLKVSAQTLTLEGSPVQAVFVAGRHGQYISVFMSVDDTQINYHNPSRDRLASGDHLVLRTLVTGENRDYILRASAPGNLIARYRAADGQVKTEPRIRGFWHERAGGYQLEIQAPLALFDGWLSLGLIDAAQNKAGKLPQKQPVWMGTVAHNEAPLALVSRQSLLQEAIAVFAHQDLRLRLVSRNQWLIAEAGQLGGNTPTYQQHGLLTWIYRWALRGQQLPPLDKPQASGQFNATEITELLDQTVSMTQRWYQWGRQRVGRAAVPIFVDGEAAPQLLGVVVAEQSTDSLQALTSSAFNRLFFYSCLAVLFTGVGLLAYASWLSYRIRQLNRAADNAIDDNGQISDYFPRSNARDELGDLNRSYAQLLSRLREYTEYLRSLSSKLSHELRTPLAVVRSSLDNLAYESLDVQAQVYARRASDGTARLSAILNAMSAASRVEESIRHAEVESVPLDALLHDLGQAYKDVYSQVTIEVVIDASVTQPQFTCAPELLVQLLDKLVDNAADFCVADGKVVLGLKQSASQLSLSVSNDGPLLPETMQHQLFDSLVSVREPNAEKAHLGLGLHIVRLITEFHRGKVSAQKSYRRQWSNF